MGRLPLLGPREMSGEGAREVVDDKRPDVKNDE